MLLAGKFIRYAPPYVQVHVFEGDGPLTDCVGKRTKVRVTDSTRIMWLVGTDADQPSSLRATPGGSIVGFEIDTDDIPLVASGMSVFVRPRSSSQGA